MRPRSLVHSGFSGSTICFGSNIVVGVPYITMPISSGLGLGLTSVVVSGCSDLLPSLVLCVARVLQLEKPKQPISASSVPAIRLEMIFESFRFIHYIIVEVRIEDLQRLLALHLDLYILLYLAVVPAFRAFADEVDLLDLYGHLLVCDDAILLAINVLHL